MYFVFADSWILFLVSFFFFLISLSSKTMSMNFYYKCNMQILFIEENIKHLL